MNTHLGSAVSRYARSFLISIIASLSCLSGASAATCYDFKLLADTSTSSNRFLAIAPFVSMNNEGTVVFTADEVGSGRTIIYHVHGTSFPVNPAVLSSSLSPSVANGGHVVASISDAINDDVFRQVIAFRGTLTLGGSRTGVWTANFDTGIASIYAGSTLSFPSINNAGLVAFSTSDTILVGNGGSLTALAAVGDGVTSFWEPMINDAMTAVVHAVLAGDETAIVTVDGRTTKIVADSTRRFDRFALHPVINDEQVVAFMAFLENGSSGIFAAADDEIETVVNSHGKYQSFLGAVSLNNHGVVAFNAVTDDGVEGIFTGANPSTHKVITVGEPLFGSSVAELNFFREGLNDLGSVAFLATLADGTQSVVRADPVDGAVSSCP